LDTMKKRIEDNFRTIDPSGKAGAECWADYYQKLVKWHTKREDFEAALKDWDSLRIDLTKETRPAEVILQILEAVDAPTRWSQLTPIINEKQARFAFLNASLIRKRLTLGDLLIFTGWDREALWKETWKRYA
jgi:glycerol-1-phosphate dehydrogenase [NAD(P)+]